MTWNNSQGVGDVSISGPFVHILTYTVGVSGQYTAIDALYMHSIRSTYSLTYHRITSVKTKNKPFSNPNTT